MSQSKGSYYEWGLSTAGECCLLIGHDGLSLGTIKNTGKNWWVETATHLQQLVEPLFSKVFVLEGENNLRWSCGGVFPEQ